MPKPVLPILYDYFNYKADVLLALHKLTSKLKAPDNIGKNRENFINEFLAVVLPQKLSVKSGEVWDKKGFKTGQIDTLIIRDDAPSLDFGGENVYLAEGVFAVIEIKSNLTTGKLKEAVKTLKKIEKLQVTKPKVRMGYYLKEHRPLRIIFAYEGATWKTLGKSIKENAWGDLFDLICILKRGVFVKSGRLLNLYHKKTGQTVDKDYIIDEKLSALAILYFYLVQYGSCFSSGSIELEGYFTPLEKWGTVKEV